MIHHIFHHINWIEWINLNNMMIICCNEDLQRRLFCCTQRCLWNVTLCGFAPRNPRSFCGWTSVLTYCSRYFFPLYFALIVRKRYGLKVNQESLRVLPIYIHRIKWGDKLQDFFAPQNSGSLMLMITQIFNHFEVISHKYYTLSRIKYSSRRVEIQRNTCILLIPIHLGNSQQYNINLRLQGVQEEIQIINIILLL